MQSKNSNVLQRLPLKNDKAHRILLQIWGNSSSHQSGSMSDKYHTPFTTHSWLGVELTVLSHEFSHFNPACQLKITRLFATKYTLCKNWRLYLKREKTQTHSGDLGTLVRNQGPTILLPLPATGALTTETQNKHLYHSRMDGAMWVQWERQAFSLSYRTRTLYYALNINPGGRRVV